MHRSCNSGSRRHSRRSRWKKLRGSLDGLAGLFVVFGDAASAEVWFRNTKLCTKSFKSDCELYMQMEVTHDRVDAELKIWG